MTPPDHISAHRTVDLLDGAGVQFVTPMSCFLDHHEHAITDDQFALGVGGRRYRALCDHLVMTESLLSPPGQPCPKCLTRLRAARPDERPSRSGAAPRRWWSAVARVLGAGRRHHPETLAGGRHAHPPQGRQPVLKHARG